jgi:hypothetical protein
MQRIARIGTVTAAPRASADQAENSQSSALTLGKRGVRPSAAQGALQISKLGGNASVFSQGFCTYPATVGTSGVFIAAPAGLPQE